MPINIQIKDNHVQSLVEFYGGKLKSVRESKKALEAEEKEYEEIINQLLKKPAKNENEAPQLAIQSFKGYDVNWAIHEKISYVLKHSHEALTTRQIIDKLLSLEPGLNATKTKTEKNISTILSIKKDKLFKRIEEKGKENKYELLTKK